MARFVAIVVLWSIVGTALGAAFGAFLSYTVGPHGTEGLILLVITWAIFAHVLVGMWAGYALLSDRSRSELPAGETVLTATIEAPAARAIGARLKEEGAMHVTAVGEKAAEPAGGG